MSQSQRVKEWLFKMMCQVWWWFQHWETEDREFKARLGYMVKFQLISRRAGDVAQQQCICLACTKSWVPFPATKTELGSQIGQHAFALQHPLITEAVVLDASDRS